MISAISTFLSRYCADFVCVLISQCVVVAQMNCSQRRVFIYIFPSLKKEFQITLLILSPALTFSIWLTQSMQFSDRFAEQIFKSFQRVTVFVSSFVNSTRHQRILPKSRYMRRFPKQIQEKWPITNIKFFYDPPLRSSTTFVHPLHTFLYTSRTYISVSSSVHLQHSEVIWIQPKYSPWSRKAKTLTIELFPKVPIFPWSCAVYLQHLSNGLKSTKVSVLTPQKNHSNWDFILSPQFFIPVSCSILFFEGEMKRLRQTVQEKDTKLAGLEVYAELFWTSPPMSLTSQCPVTYVQCCISPALRNKFFLSKPVCLGFTTAISREPELNALGISSVSLCLNKHNIREKHLAAPRCCTCWSILCTLSYWVVWAVIFSPAIAVSRIWSKSFLYFLHIYSISANRPLIIFFITDDSWNNPCFVFVHVLYRSTKKTHSAADIFSSWCFPPRSRWR